MVKLLTYEIKTMSKKDNSKMIMAAIVGAAAGALAGVLFAPESGQKSRKKLKKKAKKLKREMASSIDDLAAKGIESTGELKKSAEELLKPNA